MAFKSITDRLRHHAHHQENAISFTLLLDGETETSCLSFGELYHEAQKIAAYLAAQLPAGQRVVLLLPTGLEFITTFLGCMYANLVAVPAFPPQSRKGYRSKLASMIKDSGARLLLARSADIKEIRSWLETDPVLAGLDLAEIDYPFKSTAHAPAQPCIEHDSLAFLQYTSGSSGTAKGVMVTHGNLMDNEAKIASAFGQDKQSVIVGWLPFHHDMGLIGNILQPLYLGARAILMPPMAMLSQPIRWLNAIHKYRATTSGGPNFAYELCVQRITPEQLVGLDLSCWRVAFNGAEPIHAKTLQRFAAHLQDCGFNSQAFLPCYGLAESTLLVSGGPNGEGPRIFPVDVSRLRQGHAVTPTTQDRMILVSSGSPADTTSVCIVDPKSCTEMSARHVGEIWIKGPSVAAGYWQQPDHDDFQGSLSDSNGWFKTGDLGFLDDGQLFVTGRVKELIVVHGKNHYPQDIEQTVQECHPDLTVGAGAAFAIQRDEHPFLVVVQEVTRTSMRRLDTPAIVATVRQAVTEYHDLSLGALVLIRPGSLPKTTSGKIQRHLCRRFFDEGLLKTVSEHSWLTDHTVIVDKFDLVQLHYLPQPVKQQRILSYLQQLLAKVLSISPDTIAAHKPITALGIDSMAAITLQSRIEEDLGIQWSMARILDGPKPEDLAQALLGAMNSTNKSLMAHGPLERLELSENQRALWLIHQRHPQSSAYNLSVPMRLHGRLDIGKLTQALQTLTQRHAALRTHFGEDQGYPFQAVETTTSWQLVHQDARTFTPETLQEALAQAAFEPFDLSKSVFRCYLFQLAADQHVLLTSVHHIAADLWSLFILLEELAETYAAPKLLPAPRYHYTDFVKYQQGVDQQRGLDYWQENLAQADYGLNLPYDQAVGSGRAASLTLRLDSVHTRSLLQAAHHQETTLFTFLASAWSLLLHRFSGQDDLLLGTPFSGRGQHAFSDVVGYFVNPVVLRSQLDDHISFEDYLQKMSQMVLQAFEHGEVPFSKVVERCRPGAYDGHSSLYQVMFAYQKPQRMAQATGLILGDESASFTMNDLRVEPVALKPKEPILPLALTLLHHRDCLQGRLDYDSGLFAHGTIEQMAQCFTFLLETLPKLLHLPASRIPLWSPQKTLDSGLNRIHQAQDTYQTLHGGFERQVARQPSRTALQHVEKTSYQMLNSEANQLSHYLLQRGLSGKRVGICMAREKQLIVAILAVLKAGATYVPLDPSYPIERLQAIATDAQPEWILTHDSIIGNLAIHCLDVKMEQAQIQACSRENPGRQVPDQTPAYVIYTSGSTGRPKGVMITHYNAGAMLHWANTYFADQERQMVAASTSICFDLSVFEIFLPLHYGHSLALLEHLLALPDVGFAAQVTLINTVPSALSALLQQGFSFEGVRTVNLAGEPLNQDLVMRMKTRKDVRICNLYGPSEDTTYSTAADISVHERKPSIGLPISGTAAYVLNTALDVVPPGSVGELYLGGTGVAQGYLNQPGQSASRFLADPFSTAAGARMYRTGDLVRLGNGGKLLFLGRVDQQVKIRGFRIEPGEIETLLLANQQIAEAVIVGSPDHVGQLELVAYVVPKQDQILDINALRQDLGRTLPQYFVPGRWMILSALPKTPNGKLDRKRLPKPTVQSSTYTAPRNPLEQNLCQIWARELGLERVGVDDDFFALGGHSLSAARIVACIRAQLKLDCPLRTLFQVGTIAQLASTLTRQQVHAPELRPCEDASALRPLTKTQERLWFIQRMAPTSSAYHMAVAFSLTGDLDVERLRNALTRIINRHDMLRTSFEEQEGEVFARVTPALTVALPVTMADQALDPKAWLQSQTVQPFDLTVAPLFRSALLQQEAHKYIWFLCVHHLVADGWSINQLMIELNHEYAATTVLSAPKLRFRDYTHWQNQIESQGGFDQGLERVCLMLEGAPALLEMPTDLPRQSQKSYVGMEVPFQLSAETMEQLKLLALRERTTLFVVMLAAFKIMLSRNSGQDDVSVGTPVANRTHPDLMNVVGLFANTVVIRSRPNQGISFRRYLQQLSACVLETLEYMDVPFDKVVERLQPERSTSHTPLFQAMFVLEEHALESLQLQGLSVEELTLHNGGAKVDLTLTLRAGTHGFEGLLEYDATLFSDQTVRSFANHYSNLVLEALCKPDDKFLNLLSKAEYDALLGEPLAERPSANHNLYSVFAQRAAETPDHMAIVSSQHSLTYAQLQGRATQIALLLEANGARIGDRIGICLERDPDLIATILAVLSRGCSYVPLDPVYPKERLTYMISDSGAKLLVTTLESLTAAAHCTLVNPTQVSAEPYTLKAVSVPASYLAYVIYTSGTTGLPKGVRITHDNALAMLEWARTTYAGQERILATTSVCFDLSIFEIFLALHMGSTLLLAPRLDDLTPELAKQVTLINTVPSAMAALLEVMPAMPNLSVVNLAGEPLSRDLVDRIYASTSARAVYNLYGPSEDTTYSTAASIPVDCTDTPSIGNPVTGTRAYVLDRNGLVVPKGVTGSLFLGGHGVTQGYHGRPGLTASRYVPDAFSGLIGGRLYATGDLVRLKRDGALHFLGRNDQQVKIRGFRIELSEVEHALHKLDRVADGAVVVSQIAGDARLVAFVVLNGAQDLQWEQLAQALTQTLPGYMIPAHFHLLDALPLTPNGKIDRTRLSLMPLSQSAPVGSVGPRNPLEAQLQELWAELLGIERPGVTESFFHMGGHSLLLTRMLARIRKTFGVEIPAQNIFETPTIAALAEMLSTGKMGRVELVPATVARTADHPCSFSQRRAWFEHEMGQGISYHIVAAFRLEGMLHVKAINAALAAVVIRHEILRTTFALVNGEPRQVIGAAPIPCLQEHDYKGSWQEALAGLVRRPFDLSCGPLLRLIHMTGAGGNYLVLNHHHIISDGWSVDILLQELKHYYTEHLQGHSAPPLPALPIQYVDYTHWQAEWLKTDQAETSLNYWQTKLQGAPASLPLPYDLPKHRVEPGSGATLPLHLSKELLAQAHEIAVQTSSTLYMVILAAWGLFISRLSGSDKVLIGTPVANRGYAELEHLIGYFANTLPMAVDVTSNPSVLDLLARVRNTTVEAFAHQEIPYEMLLGAHVGCNPERAKLFQTAFALWNPSRESLKLADLMLSPVTCDTGTAKFDLTLFLEETEQGLLGFVEYSNLFRQKTVLTLMGQFEQLLSLMMANPHQAVGQLYSPGYAALLQAQHQPMDKTYPQRSFLQERVAQWASRKPEAPALMVGDTAVTFAELDRQANGLAHKLVGMGIGPDVAVALYFQRSPQMIIALLAVLKAGGYYVPLDPEYPQQRLATMLEVAQPKVIITHGSLELPQTNIPVIELHQALEASRSPQVRLLGEHPAYMIFTSGSLGQPRGVVVVHDALSNLFNALHESIYFGGENGARVSLNGPLAFDTSVKQWTRLAAGDCLVIIPQELRLAPNLFLTYLQDREVNVLDATPSHLALLVEKGLLSLPGSLNTLLIGGEAIGSDLWEKLSNATHLKCFNMYGPTECTGDATLERINDADAVVTIGQAIANTSSLVMDNRLNPVADLIAGQLCIGGLGLARCYQGLARETAAKFVPNPLAVVSGQKAYAPGSRIYLTGDLVRRRVDNRFEFLGRIDHQIKIRGFRIEPGEIETLLIRHEDVRNAYVMVRQENGLPLLTAYVVPSVEMSPTYGGRPRYRLPNNLAVAQLNANETDFLYREMFEEIAYFKHGISVADGNTIFDVGSNIGLFTVSTHFRAPNLRFFCFEPGPEVSEVLRANVALHQIDAKVFRFGLAEEERTATYTYYPEFAHLSGFFADQDDELEVVKSFVARQQGEIDADKAHLLEELIKGKLEGEEQSISLRRLSNVIDEQGITQIDLLKINVEKAEWAVFQGVDDRHWPLIKQVTVEIHDIEERLNKITNLLESHGFQVFVEQDWSLDVQATTNYYLYARRGEGADAPPPQVPQGEPILSTETLKSYLDGHIPEYMIPARFVFLERMPLNANGKIDRAALPAPDRVSGLRNTPETQTEALIQAIWNEVLNTQDCSITTDFFELGGHSLLAVNVIARLCAVFEIDMPVRTIFEAPTIGALAAVVDQQLAKGEAYIQEPMELMDRQALAPLSFGQQRIWFLNHMEDTQQGYSLPVSFQFKGQLDLSILQRALDILVARHESLRTSFPVVDGSATQRIAEPGPVNVELLQCHNLDEKECLTILRAKSAEPFDLAMGPLLRVTLLRVHETHHYLLLAQHHIISDAWSVGILVLELSLLYRAYSQNRAEELTPLPLQYRDYAAWERRHLSGERLRSKLGFWTNFLKGTPEYLALNTDRLRPQLQTFRGQTLMFNLREDQVHAVQSLTRSHGVTPFMFYLSTYAVLLSRHARQAQFHVGTPIANRYRRETENMVGLFLNTLALPMDLSENPSFSELLKQVRSTSIAAFSNGEVPFEQVVEAVKPKRTLSYSPLFQVMFTLQNAPMEAVTLPGLTMTPVELSQATAKYDLTLVMYERHGTMYGLFEYNSDLFDTSTMERWTAAFLKLLDEIPRHLDSPVSRLDLIDVATKRQILEEWNKTETPYNQQATIITLFRASVEKHPQRTALVFAEQRLDYADIEQRVIAFASQMSAKGIGVGDRVGIHCHRGVEMLASMLASMWVGAAYVPLDPNYPAERLQFILDDAAISCVVTHEWYGARFQRLPLVLVDTETDTPLPHDVPAAIPANTPAYMIYTSGSTGRPKGVVVTHQNAVNFFTAMEARIGGNTESIWLAVTSMSFDISVLELFWTLSRGDKIVLLADRPLAEEGERFYNKSMDFSLFYFAADEEKLVTTNKYSLLLEGACFADTHGFCGVWLPERHFHAFGGTFPNPSVAAAAVAAITKKISIRSGSVVLPLHDPIRVAEEWSMVDNISGGRVGLSIASGWQPNDFVLKPANFRERHRIMRDSIETLRHLWQGGTVSRRNGLDNMIDVKVHPRPIQNQLPLWITAAGSPDTFSYAGEIGAYVLTHLLGQDLDQLSEKISLYRKAWNEAGHEPGKSHVTLMIHTFVSNSIEHARQQVEIPFKNYLRSSIDLVKTMLDLDTADLSTEENRELLVQRAFERLSDTHALFGTPESTLTLVNRLKGRDIDELGCLIDFGVPDDEVLNNLDALNKLRQLANPKQALTPPQWQYEAPAELMKREGVTHLQCTPSFARILCEDIAFEPVLKQLNTMLVGGEALPVDLAQTLLERGVGTLYNMYGPTETTVWSSVAKVEAAPITLGRPVANTQLYVLDRHLEPVPMGAMGDLWIGGDGLTAGYWRRGGLTAKHFIPNPFLGDGARLYHTGDLARYLADGRLEYGGRGDHQVKLHGFRIEPGEIESNINALDGVLQSVVTVRTDKHADGRLVAYVVLENQQGLSKRRPVDFQSKHPRYRLPNGLEVHHHDSRQLGALYQELFADAIYLRHGLKLHPGSVIFDVGANIGGFSLFAHQIAAGVKIFAFEPIPPTFELLHDNLTWHGVNVQLMNMGLSDREDEVDFTYYPHMSGLSSRFGDIEADTLLARSLIVEQIEKGTLGEGVGEASEAEIDELLRESYTSEIHRCKLKTLSQVIREYEVDYIDFLKVDVEKSECYVLRGIDEEHWSKIGQISMEVDGVENLAMVTALLKEKGYEVFTDEFITVGNQRTGPALMVYMVYAYRPGAPDHKPTTSGSHLSAFHIKEALAATLPDYMVPTEVVFLEKIPLTPNGKVDQKSLPAPERYQDNEQAYVAPRNQIEEKISLVWKDVLKQDKVGVHDNFFEQGGNSLLLTHVLSQLRATFSSTISVVDLFKYPTISMLADYFAKQDSGAKPDLTKEKERAERRTHDRKKLANRRHQRTNV